ncbi:hypothetical protein TNCV_2922201 [Trichonephila clavipes]|nr:hypothetical protein TNCV_2922201 [Trichonephila clavipes]
MSRYDRVSYSVCQQVVLLTENDWPVRSPDLNPIEHIWDFLGRRLAARTLPPVTILELRSALQDEWEATPQQLIEPSFSACADAVKPA